MPNATALIFSSYDFEVHLEPSQHSIAVQARMVARNNSDKPLERIALQLSSTLHWESMQVDGKPVKFETETVDSDIDHTGRADGGGRQTCGAACTGSEHSDECDLFRHCRFRRRNVCCG